MIPSREVSPPYRTRKKGVSGEDSSWSMKTYASGRVARGMYHRYAIAAQANLLTLIKTAMRSEVETVLI
jgi:hypothetical protein